jgi:hypothetical protein
MGEYMMEILKSSDQISNTGDFHLDAGSVAQFDTPYQLITQDGILKEMCMKSGWDYEALVEIARRTNIERDR